VELFKKWEDYWPVLQCDELQRALRRVYKNWGTIRARTSKIILTNQTIIHGDMHHRNLGFRRPRAAPDVSKRHWGHSYASGELLDERNEQALPHAEPAGETNAELLEVCAIDFQGCGTGHVAYELLYFICCSLPVDIYVDTASGVKNKRMSGGSAHSGGAGSGSKKAERARKEYQFTLGELRELDNAIMREYHTSLSPMVQAAYPLTALVEDVHCLVQHWAGCLLMDMSVSSIDERSRLKAAPGLKHLLEWGEKTATRVMWMCAAIMSSTGGRASTGSTVDSLISTGSLDSAQPALATSLPPPPRLRTLSVSPTVTRGTDTGPKSR
jgi:hypothetical protein